MATLLQTGFPIEGFIFLAVVFALVKYMNSTDTPKIKGIPEIPGVPLFGNLFQLGNEHAKRGVELAKTYGPVFQVRLGNKRIVYANTWNSVRELWIGNQSALISRPKLHTFHSVVSSSQGFTIGTSPWDESCKQRRKAAATALNRPAVQSYMPIIDHECTSSIRQVLQDSKNGEIEIDPSSYFQAFALNTSLTLNYGERVEDGEMLKEIFHVERIISNLRSTSNNWQDYLPLMRLAIWSNTNRDAEEYRARRDKYMTVLLHRLKDRIAKGEDRPCISGNVLKDPEAKLNEAELKSICLTMVSAGLDTVPGNLIMGLAYLSSAAGQQIQDRAYSEIMRIYPDGNAWYKVVEEEKVEYMTAFVKEVLRFFTVIPISLPRVSISDIKYQGATIPAGTTLFMNAYAADYDTSFFKSPQVFDPERYLAPSIHATSGTPHFAYGAGSRMCAGSHLANRELYVAFSRIIMSLRLSEAANPSDRPILDALECNSHKTSLTTDPKPFKLRLKIRPGAEQWLFD